MIRGLLLGMTMVLLPLAAEARPTLWVGAEGGLLMREEGSGHRTPLAQFGPRVRAELSSLVSLSAAYGFAYDGGIESPLVNSTSQYHLLAVRPELSWRAGSAAVVLGAGPALGVVHTNHFDRDDEVGAATLARLGVSGGALLEVRVAGIAVRTGGEVFWTRGRLDLAAVIGVAFEIGEAR